MKRSLNLKKITGKKSPFQNTTTKNLAILYTNIKNQL